ncbi:MAG: E3 binding domain-containing protein, partial [Longimicrobiales bacterium]
GGPGPGPGAGAGEKAGGETADGTAEAPARRAAAESGAGADVGKASQAVAAGQSETQKGRGAETGASPKDAAGAGGGRAAGQDAAAAGGASNGDGRIKASPLARKLASEAGLELSGVSGSGPGGRITKRDIEAAIEEGDRAPAAAGAPSGVRAPAAVRRDGAEYEDVPVSQMRKTIAKRLVQSIGPIPTFYLTVEVDMTRITEARERVNAQLADQGVKASINDFLVK